MYGSTLTISYVVYVVFLLRSSEITRYCTHISIHNTDRTGEGEMRKKHEYTHTAGEEWSNEVALTQVLRRCRLMRQYLCPVITAEEKATDGRKISGLQRKRSENSRRSTQRNGEAFTKNINCRSLGICYILHFSLSICLTPCPCPLLPSTTVTRNRDS